MLNVPNKTERNTNIYISQKHNDDKQILYYYVKLL